MLRVLEHFKQRRREIRDGNTVPAILVSKPILNLYMFAFWSVLVFGVLYAVLFLDEPPSPEDHFLNGFLIVFVGIPWPPALFYVLNSRLVATEEGLTWNRFWRVKTVRWEDMLDFYTYVPSRIDRLHTPTRSLEITTSDDTFCIHTDWSKFRELKELIQAKALNAVSRQWGVPGLRDDEKTPIVYTYPKPSGFWYWPPWLGFGILCLLALTTPVAWFLILYYPLYGFIWRREREIRERQDHRITVTAEGITYESPPDRIEARWEDIVDYGYLPFTQLSMQEAKHIVYTKSGSFTFLPYGIMAYLNLVIAEKATNALPFGWGEPTVVIGGAKSLQKKGPDGRLQHVHHYRTRSALLLPFAMPVLLALVGLILLCFPFSDQDRAVAVLSAAGGLITTIGLLILEYRIEIRTDDKGIYQFSGFGHKFIRWEDVDDYYRSTNWGCIVKGKGATIRFWAAIAKVPHLRGEIRRRAVNAKVDTWSMR